MKPRALLLGCATGAALITPAVAQAAVRPVVMGLPSQKIAKSFQKLNGDANAFFPRVTTIHRGDRVRFFVAGFHNLDLPAKGAGPTALITPNGKNIAGENDAAGQAFWFNGLPQLAFNPVLLKSGFGKKFTYTGAKGINSGLPLADRPKPVVVTFARTGSFTYFCDVHPGMRGTIRVVRKSAKIPSVKTVARRVANQAASAFKTLKAISKTTPGSGTVQIGAAGRGGVESFDFFPASSSVKVGTTLVFKMPVRSTEVHSATAGPGNPESEPTSYLGTLASSIESPGILGAASYASERPGGTPASLTPTLHGNGFWNSGLLDANTSTPLAASNEVTFGAPGTYTFYCLIHPFMKATVTVTQ